MKKIFLLVLISFGFFCKNLAAEKIIVSGAVLYDLNKRESLMALYGSVEVNTADLVDGYYPVMFWIKCSKQDLIEENIIKRNTKVMDTLNHAVGYTRTDLYSPRRMIERGDNVYMEIIGRVEKFSIVNSSVVENGLDIIFTKHKKELVFDDFEWHMKAFNYQDGIGAGNFTSKIYMDGGVSKLVPDYRVILVFLKQDLAAIIYTREITVPYYESQALSMPYKIYYIKKMTD
ncbi:MAG: hypothetical protein HYZ42_05505 [Bacteroidetes bacterium]|nr:hypothetical protein [Bacteroidota bacterium]